eukprot:CAMPEP_0172083600 /NCGR_PEP_ID=MMETSP1043-20130122/20526_1 /TAXON_ID=464988 /ORGANISM="Hemiselmis andersenii, Strain CCMP441" /LENGTH=37 /DNA_ID= /DNA_START= /DNA_END= /DNA_ORIENTATION=
MGDWALSSPKSQITVEDTSCTEAMPLCDLFSGVLTST